MNMKQWLVCIALVALAFHSRAQDGTALSAEERSRQRTERMVRELALTVDQAEQVAVINDRYAIKSDSLNARNDLGRKATRAGQETLRNAYDAEIGSILTPDQLTLFLAKREELRKQQDNKPKARLRIGVR
jgi:hypothetical protein